MKQPGLYVVYAAAVRDAAGVNASPGAVLMLNGAVHYVGEPAGLEPELIAQAEVIDKRDSLILPAMVNAHTHLELTDIGPQPYGPAGGFVGWVKQLRAQEPGGEQALLASAKRGLSLSIEAGVQAVGDITRSIEVAKAVHEAGVWGFSYLELFGLGPPFDEVSVELIEKSYESEVSDDVGSKHVRIGLQPHAPYSAGHRVFDAASSIYRRCSTHLAETQEEAEFVASLSGPMMEYVRELGRWDEAFNHRYGQGLSPVQWLRPYLEKSNRDDWSFGNWLVAHCNYVNDEDIKVLADTNTSVAYCPIASEYFGHKNHRYREMLAAGVNVCLGTDSIICADPNDPQPLGVLGSMRLLYRRDGMDPEVLLQMATTNGALALLMDRRNSTLQFADRLVCVKIDKSSTIDPLTQALSNDALAQTIVFDSLPETEERVFDGSPLQHLLHRLRHHGHADGPEPA